MSRELDLAWAAGFIDGDGCITMNTRYGSPMISASQCSVVPLNALVDLFGGNITKHDDGRKATFRPSFRWRLYTAQSIAACEELLPYLRLKRRQAEILIEWAATRVGQPEKSHNPLARWRRDARNALLSEIRGLNKKGISGQTAIATA